MNLEHLEDEIFWSVCCGAEIIMHDEKGHGFCSDCGDNTTPDNELQELRKTSTMDIKTRRNLFDLGFKILCLLILLLLLISCSSYKKLNSKPCESLYSMPLSSPFFTVTYHRGKRQVYLLTDLPIANNRSHYLQHHETCERIQVLSIERKGELLKLTFQLSEEQFICYDRHLNESDITYCTRNNQKL